MRDAEYHWRMSKTAKNKPVKPRWAIVAEGLMRDQGVTQEDLVETFQVTTRGAVGHYMSGRREPSIEQIARLAKKFGVSVSQLIGELPLALDQSDRREILWLLEQIDQDNMPLLLSMLEAAATPKTASKNE